MTILRAADLEPSELNHLGDNLAAEVQRDRSHPPTLPRKFGNDIDPAERSLASLGMTSIAWLDD